MFSFPCKSLAPWVLKKHFNVIFLLNLLSVPVLKDTCKEDLTVKLEEEVSLYSENGDATHIPENMAKEEEILIKTRAKEEEEQLNNLKEVPILNDTQFTKLDELLTQTQLYSEFLLEKMDNITTTVYS